MNIQSFLFLTAALLFGSLSHAQTIAYLSEYGYPTPFADDAMYVKTITDLDSATIVTIGYQDSDHVFVESIYASATPLEKRIKKTSKRKNPDKNATLEVVNTYYPDGSKMSTYSFRDPLSWKVFFPDGNIKGELQKIDAGSTDLAPSIALARSWYFPSGNKRFQEFLDINFRPIESRGYWENGQLSFYWDGDSTIAWDEQGQVKEEITYEQDSLPEDGLQQDPYPLNIDFMKSTIGYPQAARDVGIQGQFVGRVLIDEEGRFDSFMVIESIHPILDQHILAYLPLIAFSPAIDPEGNSAPFYVSIPFNFRLLN